MQLKIVGVIVFLLLIAGCASVPERTIEISPVSPSIPLEEPEPVMVPSEENTSNLSVSTALIKELLQTCVTDVSVEFEDACLKNDDLQLELRNTGKKDIVRFEVWVRDRFDDTFEPLPDTTGLKVKGVGKKIIPHGIFTEDPYAVKVRPVIVLNGTEVACIPSTELYETSRDILTRC